MAEHNKRRRPLGENAELAKGHPVWIVDQHIDGQFQSLYDAAVAWYDVNHNNPQAKQFTGTKDRQLHDIQQWIIDTNHIKTSSGNICDITYNYPFIMPGDHIYLPEGKPIGHVKQHNIVVKPCLVKTPPAEETPPPVDIAPPPPAPPVAMAPPPPPIVREAPRPPIEYFTPVSHATNRTKDADGKYTWQVGSTDHALELLARVTGDKEHYDIDAITPRGPITKERYSGQDQDFNNEGKNRGGNAQSKKDDGNAKRNDLQGGKGLIASEITGERGQSFVAGFTKLREDGGFDRTDKVKGVGFVVHQAGMTFTVPLTEQKIVVPLPTTPFYTFTNPAKEQTMVAVTNRGGLTQATSAGSDLQLVGRNQIFSDEQTQKTVAFTSPQDIYAYAYLKTADKTYNENMERFNNAAKTGNQAEKYDAALQMLVAKRDYNDNQLIKRIDSGHEPARLEREAMLSFFAGSGLARDQLDIEARQAPRIDIRDMSEEQKKALPGFDGKSGGDRYGDIIPNGHAEQYRQFQKFAYLTENSVELKVAQGLVPDLYHEKGGEARMIDTSHEAWSAILNNEDAKKVFIEKIRNGAGNPDDHNAQMAAGSILHDMQRNPQNYGFIDAKGKPDQKAADAFVTQFVSDVPAELHAGIKGKTPKETQEKIDAFNKGVAGEILRKGNTNPIPFVPDQSFSLERPELFGPTIAHAIDKKPALFNELMDRATNPAFSTNVDPKHPTKGDGRRFGMGMLHAVGADRILDPNAKDGDVAPALAKLQATFQSSDDKARITQAVELSSNYTESAARNVNLTKVNQLDDKELDMQIAYKNAKTNAPDATWLKEAQPAELAVYQKFFVEGGHNEVVVQGLAAHPALAHDAILLTVLQNPKAFERSNPKIRDGLKDQLHDYGSTVIHAGEYDTLEDTIASTIKSVNKYHDAKAKNDPKADHYLEAAVKRYDSFFRSMENGQIMDPAQNHGSAKESSNKALQKENALQAMVTDMLGRDPKLYSAVIDTMATDPNMVHAAIKSVPSTLALTENLGDHQNRGRLHGDKNQVKGIKQDDVYTTRFTQLPTKTVTVTDKKTHEKHQAEQVVDARGFGIFGWHAFGDHQVKVDLPAVKEAINGNAQLVQQHEVAPAALNAEQLAEQQATTQQKGSKANKKAKLNDRTVVNGDLHATQERIVNGQVVHEKFELGTKTIGGQELPTLQTQQPVQPLQLNGNLSPLSPELQAQARGLLQNVTQDHNLGDALHMNQQVLIPGAANMTRQQQAEQLTEQTLKNALSKQPDLLQNLSPQQQAQFRQNLTQQSLQLLQNGDIKLAIQPNGQDLQLTLVNSQNLQTTLQTTDNLGMASGIDSRVLLFGLFAIHGGNPPIPCGQVCDVSPVPPPIIVSPVPPVISPTGPQVATSIVKAVTSLVR